VAHRQHKAELHVLNKAIKRCMLQVMACLPGGDGYMCRCHEADLRFMVAFESPVRAVEWCLLVQVGCWVGRVLSKLSEGGSKEGRGCWLHERDAARRDKFKFLVVCDGTKQVMGRDGKGGSLLHSDGDFPPAASSTGGCICVSEVNLAGAAPDTLHQVLCEDCLKRIN
jgi:hypothetical protein